VKLNRLLYLGYYIKELDKNKLIRFATFVKDKHEVSYARQAVEIVQNILKYNISILEYYQFNFYRLTDEEKDKWAGTGFMYEYQRTMNPPAARIILHDKRHFARAYGEFILHSIEDSESLKAHPAKIFNLLNNPSGKIVFKDSTGNCGRQVFITNTADFTSESLLNMLESSEYNLVEEFIIQHDDLQYLSPSGVNTVRIFTQLNDENKVDILGCRLRITVNSEIDNLAAGNLAAPIDEHSGIVCGPGVYSDITKEPEINHPVTGKVIQGFQVPYWKETIELVKNAALRHPQNRTIGWDIAIMKNGPGLIEGNHDWCKLLWQLPVQQGLREKLLKYI
jgi:hypothetical protein